jgi:hypothetical protein
MTAAESGLFCRNKAGYRLVTTYKLTARSSPQYAGIGFPPNVAGPHSSHAPKYKRQPSLATPGQGVAASYGKRSRSCWFYNARSTDQVTSICDPTLHVTVSGQGTHSVLQLW